MNISLVFKVIDDKYLPLTFGQLVLLSLMLSLSSYKYSSHAVITIEI